MVRQTSGKLRTMRASIIAIILAAGCSTATTQQKPDHVSQLIADRYSSCVPGLKAADIKRVTDSRYTWSDPKGRWILAWRIAGSSKTTGEPFTAPTDDAMSQFEKLGCL